MSVYSVGAVLLISDDAESLTRFYRDAIGLALEDERHEGVPLRYACELGATHAWRASGAKVSAVCSRSRC